MQQPQILILREGTDQSQGRGALLSNISACLAVVNCVATTLGPRGSDKLIVDNRGEATISNDGATIMKLLDIVHPAAKTLVDIARAQDAEVGDGTTSVVLLAGELLKESRSFVEDGVSPHLIIKGYRKALQKALAKIEEIAVTIEKSDETCVGFRHVIYLLTLARTGNSVTCSSNARQQLCHQSSSTLKNPSLARWSLTQSSRLIRLT